jgi:alpha-beta hydrolase superfamily lysophospholipase
VQGCGRSEGKRGLRFYVEKFDDYVQDVLQLARWAGAAQQAWAARWAAFHLC